MNPYYRSIDYMFKLTGQLKGLIEKAFKEENVGMGQLNVLLYYYQSKQTTITQKELTDHLQVDKGNISRNIAKLCDKGLLTQISDSPKSYAITEDGNKLKHKLMDYMRKTYTKMTRDIDEGDLITTLSVIMRMIQNLEE